MVSVPWHYLILTVAFAGMSTPARRAGFTSSPLSRSAARRISYFNTAKYRDAIAELLAAAFPLALRRHIALMRRWPAGWAHDVFSRPCNDESWP